MADTNTFERRSLTESIDWVEHAQRSMGGHLGIRVVFADAFDTSVECLVRDLLRRVGARVDAWASLLTRHHPSQLTRLNAASGAEVPVGPTLAALLSWSADAWEATGGLVNIAMLDERIAAETGTAVRGQRSSRGWQLDLRHWRHDDHAHLRGGLLRRPEGLRLDLDGVGKGWIADRAVALLVRLLDAKGEAGEIPAWKSCFVDGDGDIALRHRSGAETEVRIEVPREAEATIGAIQVGGPSAGVATSGTGVHRWGGRHHLIDPHTGAPADSGIAQATVVAESAREAEAWAKSIVIGGAALIRRAEAAGIRRIVAVQANGGIVSAPAFDRSDARHRFTPVDARRFDATVPAR